MNYLFIIGICVIFLLVIILITQFKKIKSSEAYVIERKGKFNRVETSRYIFLIPFLDKIKCIINLNPQILMCYPSKAILADNSSVSFKMNIFFKVIDAEKVAYQEKDVESQLECLGVSSFRGITKKMNSSDISYLNEKINMDLKTTLNKFAYKFGCEVDEIKIEILNDSYKFNFENYIHSSVRNYSSQKSNILIYIAIAIVLIISYMLSSYLGKAYIKTNNLWFFLLHENALNIAVCGGIVLSSIFVLARKKQTSILTKIWIIILVFLGTSILLCTFDAFRKTNIGNFNMLEYKYEIIKDIFSNQTTTIQTSNIYCEKDILTRNRSRHNRKHRYPAYIAFGEEDAKNRYYSAELTGASVVTIEYLKELEDTITIEYYNNSKIIKSIDGIEKFDVDKFEKRIAYLLDLKKEEKAKEDKLKQEQEEKEKIEKNLSTQKYIIAQNSIGKKFEDVKKELEAIGTSDISIKYINSKYYPIGTVAFVERDGENFSLKTFYVVENNSSEDLTKMPQLKRGMSKDELIQIFEKSELNYKFAVQKSDASVKGLYLYVPPGTGTYVPKGSIIKVTIYE